ETLVAIAARLREVSADAFRVGGDKFLLLHHDATLDDAATLARSLVDNNSFGITFSAVVFALHRDMTSDFASLLDTLTGALYLAEVARGRAERNVVVLA
ncbi:MAG TPA: hypothetical protein VJZ00_22470, partial [Thermoanaerobaculia bacterium]|nr:hypothetical protein [Thermoanaerobaculia bacterium]